jgi:hypothetical protein
MKKAMNELKDRAEQRLKAEGHVPQRLYDELDDIEHTGGAPRLLRLSNLVNHLRTEGIVVGPGFGYATCSLLCYGLGLTDVNPVTWNLPFERFIRSFHPGTCFWIETSEDGYEKTVAYLNSTCDQPIRINPTNRLIVEGTSSDDGKSSGWRIGLAKRGSHAFGRMTPGMEALINTFRPCRLSDYVLLEALYRPSMMRLLPEVIRRKQSYAIFRTGLKAVDRLLEETYGLVVYQEQAIQIEQVLEGMVANDEVLAVRRMIDVPWKELFLKGHAVGRVMENFGD